MLRPKMEAIERGGGIHQTRRGRFRPRQGRAAGQGRGGHGQKPALPQCRGRRHARRHRDRRRHRHPRSDERNLRAARRRGRSPEIQRPQGVLRRHQSHASLSRENSFPLVHPPRHGRGEQDAARPGHGQRQPRRSLRRHAREALDRRARYLRHRRRLPVSAGDGLRGGRQRRLYDAARAQGGHHSRRRQFAAAALCRRAHRAAGDLDGPPPRLRFSPKAA